VNFFTFEFFVFFTFVLILNWFLKKWSLAWRLFLLIVSYLFYYFWDFNFLLIIFLASFFNYFAGFFIYKNIFNKKIIFFLAVIGNILVLVLFKYYDFFRVSAEELLDKIGIIVTFPLLDFILPIGLSFYIFRIISYVADVYLKKIPSASFLDFLIYVAFFPQLLAGPIMRASDFLVQIKDGGVKKLENLYDNIALILLGLFKKLVISSYLVVNITDDVFAVPENHSSHIILLAVLAYTLVIYFDFSGYSDMAIGFAGLMGFKSPLNFNSPYLALNIKEFWRRWHISLSTWVKDYIYIPLGGNRKGKLRKYFNLFLSMVLIGLWHGAAFHFIFWGAIHGIALVFSHIFNFSPKKAFSKLVLGILTFSFVSFGWIFFRSNTLKDAFVLLKNIFDFGRETEPLKIYIIIVLLIGFFLFLFEKQINRSLVVIQQKMSLVPWLLFVILLFILILKFSPDTVPNFIYFNF